MESQYPLSSYLPHFHIARFRQMVAEKLFEAFEVAQQVLVAVWNVGVNES